MHAIPQITVNNKSKDFKNLFTSLGCVENNPDEHMTKA